MIAGTTPMRGEGAAVPPASNVLGREHSHDSTVAVALRRQVANAFLLFANYKRYHWQAFGPHFRELHKLFDELASDVLTSIDPLAERIRMIGPDPPAHPLEWSELATVSAAPTLTTVRQMIEEADHNALLVVREMREGAALADKHHDPGTVDLFTRFVQMHEKHEWWLRDTLRSGDGFRA